MYSMILFFSDTISSCISFMFFKTVIVFILTITGWGRGNFTPPPCWFSPNNSEVVKAATLALCSI